MKSLLKLFKYPFRYKVNVSVAILAMIVQVAIGFIIPMLMITIIDEAIPSNDQPLLIRTGAIMLGVALIGLFAGIINAYNSQKVASYSSADLRNVLYKKIQSLSFTNIDKLKTSRLITTSTNDVARIQMFFQMLLRIIVRAPLMIGIGIFMAIETSKELSNIFYITLPILIVSIIIIMIIAFPKFSKVQKTIDGLNKATLETAQSPRVIKSFVSMKHENNKFADANELFRKTNTAANKVMAVAEPIIMLIFNASLAGIIFLAAYYIDQGLLINVVDGEQVPAVGVMIAFNNYSMQILFGLMMFAMMMIFISRAVVSANRIIEVLEEKVDLQNCENCIETFDVKGNITFNNVSFGYEKGGNLVLKDINFSVESGERVGIIGSTGSGKSSLIHLIPRLYDVSDGEILIDGVNVKQINMESLRSQISIVTQSATIFSGSIATNIRQGNMDADLEALEKASKSASALEFIDNYDDYFNHMVEQKGKNLSGGQKQRVSLARAFVRNPKILILDDSTSAVDAKSEEQILNAIETISHKTTTLVISQKISTISKLDKILVLNNKGEIDGFGTHQTLLKESKVYQEIAQSQIGLGGEING